MTSSRCFVRCVLVVAAVCSLAGSVSAQVFTAYPIPTADSIPTSITLGPDGALWFTEFRAGKIGRITTDGTITEFTVPTVPSAPDSITTGPDGAMWFVEYAGSANKIGRVTTGGVFSEFAIPTPSSSPQGIVAGPDGNLWFTESSGNKIGRITPGGIITEFPLPLGLSSPRRIAVGPDRNLWFTEWSGRIGRILPGAPNTITEFSTNGIPYDITAGPDGALWYTTATPPWMTELNTAGIGRITTAGTGVQYGTLNPPRAIAAGPDGALYFGVGNKVGRITTAGVLTQFAPPSVSSQPNGVVAGTDGALWFTDSGTNEIGRMFLDKARVANISTRGVVQGGGDVMIAGIIIQGNTPQKVAVTATGPSLAAFGIANPLGNPALAIVRSSDQAVIATNDDWQTDPNAANLLASGFAPAHPLEAGILLTLQPGAYTAIVSGAGGSTGVSVVGVFAAP